MNYSDWLSHFVKIGLFVTLMLPLVELATAPASAQGLEPWNKPCLKYYKKWKTMAKHKAFAVSNSNAGGGIGQSCAYSYAHPTKAAAEAAAIKSCGTEKHYRSGRCYVMKSE
jgi:hypothetical protein